VLLWLFSESMSSSEGFARVGSWLSMPITKILVWAILSGLLYHLIAGIKHLVMDLGIGETLAGAQTAARLVVALSIIAIVASGVWLW